MTMSGDESEPKGTISYRRNRDRHSVLGASRQKIAVDGRVRTLKKSEFEEWKRHVREMRWLTLLSRLQESKSVPKERH